jgi:hypothetical protein
MKGWFLTGVWSTLLVVLFIYTAITSNIGGMVLTSILSIITALLIGMFIGESEKK